MADIAFSDVYFLPFFDIAAFHFFMLLTAAGQAGYISFFSDIFVFEHADACLPSFFRCYAISIATPVFAFDYSSPCARCISLRDVTEDCIRRRAATFSRRLQRCRLR